MNGEKLEGGLRRGEREGEGKTGKNGLLKELTDEGRRK